MSSLPRDIAGFLEDVREISGVEAAWLIGSRANGGAQPRSDWDILLFGTESTPAKVANGWPKGVPNLDLLVVYDGENFRSPWSRPDTGTFKRGSLSSWEWKEVQPDEAIYTQRRPAEGPHINVSDARAVLLFRVGGAPV